MSLKFSALFETTTVLASLIAATFFFFATLAPHAGTPTPAVVQAAASMAKDKPAI